MFRYLSINRKLFIIVFIFTIGSIGWSSFAEDNASFIENYKEKSPQIIEKSNKTNFQNEVKEKKSLIIQDSNPNPKSNRCYRWAFDQQTPPAWQVLDKGLQLGTFPGFTDTGGGFELIILRIDPHFYDVTLHMASQSGKALSLYEWSMKYNLDAAINASMYLPDGLTSTGYLRNAEHINNGHIASSFGAFLVADPYNTELISADLLDRTTDDWESLLPQYKVVVQNYRIISANRQLLWHSKKITHSIAAVARDGEGFLLFIHSRYPMSDADFGNLLLSLPIDIHVVMYVEGGSQAGLLVKTPVFTQLWMGRHPVDILNIDNTSTPLPNVIGIKRKESSIPSSHKNTALD